MIVVAVSVVSDDHSLVASIPALEIQRDISRHISSRLTQNGIPMPVADLSHYKDPPEGVLGQNVLMVFVRVDVAPHSFNNPQRMLIGAVSTWIRRDVDALLSSEPATFFRAENDSDDLEAQVKQATIAQIERSIINPIVALAK
jgi:hypothetical protein